MKIFALYTTITLTKKPDWFDDFLSKYNPWDLHVTLKQACYIEDDKINDLKKKVALFFSEHEGKLRPIHIVFDRVQTGKAGNDPVLLLAEKNEAIMRLQRDLCTTLSGYKNYIDPMTEEYEKNFRPHITISYNIPAEEYAANLNVLSNGCKCEGVMNEVVLSVVGSITPEEARNPLNKKIYSLASEVPQ